MLRSLWVMLDTMCVRLAGLWVRKLLLTSELVRNWRRILILGRRRVLQALLILVLVCTLLLLPPIKVRRVRRVICLSSTWIERMARTAVSYTQSLLWKRPLH